MDVCTYLLERFCKRIEKFWKEDEASVLSMPRDLDERLLSKDNAYVFPQEEQTAFNTATRLIGEYRIQDLKLELQAMSCAAQARDAAIAYLENTLQAYQDEISSEKRVMKILSHQNFRLRKELAASHAKQRCSEKQLAHMCRTQTVWEEAQDRLCTQLAESKLEWLEELRSFKNEISSLQNALKQKEAQDANNKSCNLLPLAESTQALDKRNTTKLC